MLNTREIYEPVDAAKVAKALSEYIKKNGMPKAEQESIEVLIDGETVYINPWSVRETR